MQICLDTVFPHLAALQAIGLSVVHCCVCASADNVGGKSTPPRRTVLAALWSRPGRDSYPPRLQLVVDSSWLYRLKQFRLSNAFT